jgi:hypothetical protein
MAAGKVFGSRPVGTVAIVETPVSQWYAKRARLAFLVCSFASGMVTAVALAAFYPILLALVIGVLAGSVCGFMAGALVRSWPVLRALWWWSLEVTAFVAVVLATSWLVRATSAWLVLTAVLLTSSVFGLVRPVRRSLVALGWCVVVRHRLRMCFAGILRGSGGVRPGSLPLILWARPTPAGERVWLWLRPGLELADMDGKTGRIAVACWAKQVRVVAASEKYAALIRVDIARRDPLAGRIDSPLALLIPTLRNINKAVTPVSPAVPPVGLDLADIPEPAPEPRSGRR